MEKWEKEGLEVREQQLEQEVEELRDEVERLKEEYRRQRLSSEETECRLL